MKHKNISLIFGLVIYCCPPVIHAGNMLPASTVLVFKLDGTVHCENSAGISLDSMQKLLTNAGIKVLSMRKGYDGREGIAVCGAPTGQINIYEIASSDLSLALKFVFRQLPENWTSTDQ